jgi:small nuclear ribonucleoprotein (snRNP)-like protein
LQFVRRALSLPIQNQALFARKSRPDHAEGFVMKRYLSLIIVIAALTSSSLLAQEKAALQPNATVLSVLQGSVGKTVELRMNGGEKIGGKVEQVNDNLVLLSHLTGAEYFDGFVNIKDISAVVIRSAGK